MKSYKLKVEGYKFWLAMVLVATCNLQPATLLADLAVSATPGFVFSDTPSGRPTVANLNRALNMTYAITGSIGGTNAGLSAGSVNGTMLMDSVVDNVTVQFVGSPRGIEVIDGGINIDQINSAIAGLGLGGGSGAALSNKTDNVTITITNDVLTLHTNIPVSYVKWTTNTILGASTYGTNTALSLSSDFRLETNTLSVVYSTFISGEYAFDIAGSIVSTNHSLGTTPSYVRAVLVCKTNDLSWVVGDEVGLESVYNSAGGTSFNITATATQIKLIGNVASASHAMIKSDGNGQNITTVRWRLKIYARP